MEYCPPLHLGVVAIEKGAFWAPSTTLANNYIYIYMYKFMSKGCFISFYHLFSMVYCLVYIEHSIWKAALSSFGDLSLIFLGPVTVAME